MENRNQEAQGQQVVVGAMEVSGIESMPEFGVGPSVQLGMNYEDDGK